MIDTCLLCETDATGELCPACRLVAVPSADVNDGTHLRREDWRIRSVTQAEAVEFISRTLDDDKLCGVASMRLIDRAKWPTLLTYADTREGHTGAIYRATNWTCLGEVRGSDAWAHALTGERRGRKRGGRNRSVEEMAEAGFVRLPTVPKIKFIHDRSAA